MVARGSRKDIDKAQAEKYRRVGAALLESARVLAEVAADGDSFGNAIAVVAVHACIAYNDALSIAWRGVKSTEGRPCARGGYAGVRAGAPRRGRAGAAAPVRAVAEGPGFVPGQLVPGERGRQAPGAGSRVLRLGGEHLRPASGTLIRDRAGPCAWMDRPLRRHPQG
jgi:hypothetical protein